MLLLAMLLLASLLCGSQSGSSAVQEETGTAAAPVSGHPFKVSITTGGGLYGPVRSRFKVGEDIPISISLNNTGDKPAKYCISTILLQNRPQLKRDGQLLPYLSGMVKLVDTGEFIQRCEDSERRRFYELQPKQTRIVDWFTIGRRTIDWYGELPAGHYELVLMRRIQCCQGPMDESNKVTFEIVP